MSPERQRIAIAEACEFTSVRMVSGLLCGLLLGSLVAIPDYLNDLNVMHEAKRKLLSTSDLCNKFNRTLIECRSFRSEFETDKWTWGQPAEVEVEALLRTIGKWEGEQ